MAIETIPPTDLPYNPSLASFDHLTNRVLPEPDIFIHTSTGERIPAHTSILASVSPVLENIIDQPRRHRGSERIIQIHGVPFESVTAFLGFLYSSRCTDEQMERYGIHLLALAHVYLVPQLKQRCIKVLAERLSIENVVDLLQLARLCDAPDLYIKCMKLLTNHFKSVEQTEGWKFLQKNDPWLELEILRFMDEDESRKRESRKRKEEQRLYAELSEAMECLEHICTDGCTDVGPNGSELRKEKRPCARYDTCHGIQLLITHFATCTKRMKGGCLRCKRMWQLFRLHSYLCQQSHSCKVPLCREMQMKMQLAKRKDDQMWKLLARKVASARIMSTLSLPKRKRDDEIRINMGSYGIRSFKLK